MSITQSFRTFRQQTRVEFREIVDPLLAQPEVQKLDDYIQHVNYTRLGHSLDVAYLSFCIAKLLRCDSKSCARAGLLHDLYYRSDDLPNTWEHMKSHPTQALENARTICDLTDREEDIILKHMWLANLSWPRYKESFIVTFVDKACALRERMFGMSKKRITRRERRLTAAPMKLKELA
ncbi:MAG: HD domain-containing protein [Oscillospiraceae bacterium]|nr:HD domain-containing protein [Oscillospiraceae bacterium]